MIHMFFNFISQPWCVFTSNFTHSQWSACLSAIEVNTFFQISDILFGSSSFSMLAEFSVSYRSLLNANLLQFCEKRS